MTPASHGPAIVRGVITTYGVVVEHPGATKRFVTVTHRWRYFGRGRRVGLLLPPRVAVVETDHRGEEHRSGGMESRPR
jgi:hypothetical protein